MSGQLRSEPGPELERVKGIEPSSVAWEARSDDISKLALGCPNLS